MNDSNADVSFVFFLLSTVRFVSRIDILCRVACDVYELATLLFGVRSMKINAYE